MMLGPFQSAAKSLRTSREYTAVRFFARMNFSNMSLQVLQPGVGFRAVLIATLVWLFPRVSPHMNNQHVPFFEGLSISLAILPLADKVNSLDMIVSQMFNKLLLRIQVSMTTRPTTLPLAFNFFRLFQTAPQQVFVAKVT